MVIDVAVIVPVVIVPLTCNPVVGFVVPIPTLPSLRIVITIFDVLYAPSDNAISNLDLDLVLSATDLPNLKVALMPVSYIPETVPTLHKCKTSTGSMIVGTV